MYGYHIWQSMDQPGKVANHARGQLNRQNEFSPVPVRPQPAHLHTQAKSGAYLRDSSRVSRRRPFMKPSYAIGSVPSLSGHAIAYRWRSLPRVRRHEASKSQGSSERVLPWQVTMDQLIFASLSHTHYWYEVGMLKVPAVYPKNNRFPNCLQLLVFIPNCRAPYITRSITAGLPGSQ